MKRPDVIASDGLITHSPRVLRAHLQVHQNLCYNQNLRVSDSAAMTPLARPSTRLSMVSIETAIGSAVNRCGDLPVENSNTSGIFGVAGSGG